MKVSVIIPIYNSETYLVECIESALNQTMKKNEYEIILINDASEDKSMDIALQYKKNNENIIMVNNQKNKGVSFALNTGIKMARGKYIYTLAADDYIDKDLLKSCFEIGEKQNLDIVYFGYKSVYDKKEKLEIVSPFRDGETILSDNIPSYKVFTGKEIFKIQHWLGAEFVFLLKREFLLNNNLLFNENSVIEDLEFSPRLFMTAKRVMKLDDVFYYYRIRMNSLSNNTGFNKRVESSKVCIYSLINLTSKFRERDLLESFKRYFFMDFGQLLRYIEKEYKENFEKKFIEAINEFIPVYVNTFGNELTEDECLYFCKIEKQFYKNFKKRLNEKIDENILNVFLNASEKREKVKEKFLKDIPLVNSDKLIGVYGLGEHSINLLNCYEASIGKIQANVIFIDSFVKDLDKKFLNRKIINVKDINFYKFDCIVISSSTFEKELCENLLRHLEKEIKIFRFYEKYECLLFD